MSELRDRVESIERALDDIVRVKLNRPAPNFFTENGVLYMRTGNGLATYKLEATRVVKKEEWVVWRGRIPRKEGL